MKKKIHCIVQARLTSRRLPGKIFLTGYKKSLIDHLIERLNFSKKISKVIIATPKTNNHNYFKSHFNKENIFYGSEKDVLERYYKCAKKFDSDIIIRITSDCPLMDYRIIDNMLEKFNKNKCDYLSNVHPPSYPKGFDIEIFTFEALEKTFNKAKKKFQREHVTPYIWDNPSLFKVLNFTPKNIRKNLYKNLRLTLDYLEDFILISIIFKNLYKKKKNFSFEDILNFLNKNKKISKISVKYKNDKK